MGEMYLVLGETDSTVAPVHVSVRVQDIFPGNWSVKMSTVRGTPLHPVGAGVADGREVVADGSELPTGVGPLLIVGLGVGASGTTTGAGVGDSEGLPSTVGPFVASWKGLPVGLPDGPLVIPAPPPPLGSEEGTEEGDEDGG